MDVTHVINALRQQQRELDQQIKSITERRAEIDTAISVLEGMGDNTTGATQSDEDNQASLDSTAEQVGLRDAEPRQTREDGPQATLRRLMRERPGEEVDSKAAHEWLIAAGWHSNSKNPVNVVRTALAAMANRGEIVKRERGKYAYEPDGSSEPEKGTVSAEATVVPGTLDLVESDYGSGSYSHGTAISAAEETVDNPRQAFDPHAPHRVAVNQHEQAPGA